MHDRIKFSDLVEPCEECRYFENCFGKDPFGEHYEHDVEVLMRDRIVDLFVKGTDCWTSGY